MVLLPKGKHLFPDHLAAPGPSALACNSFSPRDHHAYFSAYPGPPLSSEGHPPVRQKEGRVLIHPA